MFCIFNKFSYLCSVIKEMIARLKPPPERSEVHLKNRRYESRDFYQGLEIKSYNHNRIVKIPTSGEFKEGTVLLPFRFLITVQI